MAPERRHLGVGGESGERAAQPLAERAGQVGEENHAAPTRQRRVRFVGAGRGARAYCLSFPNALSPMSFVIGGALVLATLALFSIFFFAMRDPASKKDQMKK